MPELPDLEIVRRVLEERVVDVPIASAEVLRPLIVRNLLAGSSSVQQEERQIDTYLVGRRFISIGRRGKFLLLALEGGAILVIHPMLAGRLRYSSPLPSHRKRDALVVRMVDGNELRYHDAKDMGKVYLTENLDQVPTLSSLGPEANDPLLTLDRFRERLRSRRGEIKGVLVDQGFVAGIGNAYADEILWQAQIYPFRRRPSLDEGEIAALHNAMQTVLTEAVEILAQRVDQQIDLEVRDFLAVHGRGGQACARCGGTISEVRRKGSATHFCRNCQPGLMVAKNRRLSAN
jgi:formamidopyrimidine-DNA glycosylase